MSGDRGGFTRDELSDIALAAAKEGSRQTLNEIFALLGVNLMNFEDVKSFREELDFARTMKLYREDLEFAHALRTSSKKIGAKFVLTIVTVVAGAVAIGAWEYVKAILHVH